MQQLEAENRLLQEKDKHHQTTINVNANILPLRGVVFDQLIHCRFSVNLILSSGFTAPASIERANDRVRWILFFFPWLVRPKPAALFPQ